MSALDVDILIGDLPRFVRGLTAIRGIWLVGSTANIGPGFDRDIDLAVSWSAWTQFSPRVPSSAKSTSRGGWRFMVPWEEHERMASIDAWPVDLSEYLISPGLGVAIELSTRSAWRRESDDR